MWNLDLRGAVFEYKETASAARALRLQPRRRLRSRVFGPDNRTRLDRTAGDETTSP